MKFQHQGGTGLKLETEHDKSLICFGMTLNKRISLNLKL